jgi:hypothetical protein
MANTWGNSWGSLSAWANSWGSSSTTTDDCIFDTGIFDTGIFDHCEDSSRSRGDTWVGGDRRQPSRPRRYLDRLEKQERDELEKVLDKAIDEVVAEPEAAKPLKAAQQKQVAALVRNDLQTLFIDQPIFSAGFLEVTASLANLERLVSQYYDLRRLRREQAIAAEIREAQRLDDEAAMLLLMMVM